MNINNITKKFASIALGTTILFASVTGTSAATYTVKNGDTLAAIAKNEGTRFQVLH